MKVAVYSFLIVSLHFFVLSVSAQKRITGMVKDQHSEEGVPFASVRFKNTTIGKSTDSSGAFSFYLDSWPSDSIEITCVGYQPYVFAIDKTRDTAIVTIMLEIGTCNEGVKLKFKLNKGLRVWRKIVQ